MRAQPADQVIDELVRVGLKFERMVRFGILDDFAIGRGKLFNEFLGWVVLNDSVLTSQHQKNGKMKLHWRLPKVFIQVLISDKETGCRSMKRQGIVTKKL